MPTYYRMFCNICRGLYNIITAGTNLISIFPYMTSIHNNDYMTAYLIFAAAFASFFSHLFESHKHGMYGFNCSITTSKILNKIDIIAALALISRVGFLIYPCLCDTNIPYFVKLSLFSGTIMWLFLMVSESDYSSKTQLRYLICHNIWHIGIFTTLNYFLVNYYL